MPSRRPAAVTVLRLQLEVWIPELLAGWLRLVDPCRLSLASPFSIIHLESGLSDTGAGPLDCHRAMSHRPRRRSRPCTLP